MSKLVKILLVFLLLFVVLGVVAALVLRTRLTEDSIVADVERALDCRVQIGSHESVLVGGPASLTLHDLVVAPRDAVVDAGTPHSEREPIGETSEALKAERVDLELSLTGFLKKRIDVEQLVFHGLDLQLVIDEKGDDNIQPLLRKPKKKTDLGEKAGTDDPKKKKKKRGRLAIPTTIDRIGIESGKIVIKNAKQGSETRLENLHLILSDIDIDANSLEEHNHCRADLSTHLILSNTDTRETFLDFQISGDAEGSPLDPADGLFGPNMVFNAKIDEGGWVAGLPFLHTLSNSLEALDKIGLNLDFLGMRGELAQPLDTKVRVADKKLVFEKPAKLDFGSYAVGIENASWIDTAALQHDFRGGISLSEGFTKTATDGVETFLREKAGKRAAEMGLEAIIDPLVESGRLSLIFKSTGSLSKPEVGLANEIGDVESVMEEVGKRLIRSLRGDDPDDDSNDPPEPDESDKPESEGKGTLKGLFKDLLE